MSCINNGAFKFPAGTLTTVATIKCEVVRRILRNRIGETNGLMVRYAGDRFLKLDTNLRCWADFLQRGPVRTSYGSLSSADLPSVLSAIAILEPIVAAIRGASKHVRSPDVAFR